MWPGRSRTCDSWIRSQTLSRYLGLSCKVYMSHRMTKPTKWPLRPAKTRINLRIRPVWSESSLSTWRNIGSSATNWAHYEDSDETGRIWVFAGHRGFFVGFIMRWLTFRKCILIFASGLRNKPHFWRPFSLALWLQSQGSLVRAPDLPHTGYTCNLRRISHEIMYMVFLLFQLIQERQFLVISESICTLDHFVLVNCLEGLILSSRRSGLGHSFNCIPGIHRPRISQSDLLVHAQDSRSPKSILA